MIEIFFISCGVLGPPLAPMVSLVSLRIPGGVPGLSFGHHLVPIWIYLWSLGPLWAFWESLDAPALLWIPFYGQMLFKYCTCAQNLASQSTCSRPCLPHAPGIRTTGVHKLHQITTCRFIRHYCGWLHLFLLPLTAQRNIHYGPPHSFLTPVHANHVRTPAGCLVFGGTK